MLYISFLSFFFLMKYKSFCSTMHSNLFLFTYMYFRSSCLILKNNILVAFFPDENILSKQHNAKKKMQITLLQLRWQSYLKVAFSRKLYSLWVLFRKIHKALVSQSFSFSFSILCANNVEDNKIWLKIILFNQNYCIVLKKSLACRILKNYISR